MMGKKLTKGIGEGGKRKKEKKGEWRGSKASLF